MPTKTRDSISRLPAYSMGVQSIDNVDRIIQLGQNELGIAASPNAIAAVQQSAGELHRYSDMHHNSLRQAIAQVHDIDPDRIACGVGSMELMGLLATIYCEPGVDVVVSQYGYKFFQVQCSVAGANLVIVPEPEMRTDLDAIAAAVTAQTRLIFIVNPNNPTGATLATGDLKKLRDSVPEDILIVIDGAYAEFADIETYESGLQLVDQGRNLAVLRTFSKAYGLAGSRIGWIYAPADVIQAIARVRTPGSITAQALAAAEAAILDQQYLVDVVAEVTDLRQDVQRKIISTGLQVYPSGGNFLLVRFHNDSQAGHIFSKLLEAGIICRPMGSYELNDCLRITIGSREEMKIFWRHFQRLIAGSGL